MRLFQIALRGIVTLSVLVTLAAGVAGVAQAADINVIGIFGARATLMVDGGRPRTLSIGESTPEGIKLLSVGEDNVVVNIGGSRETLRMGNQRIAAARTNEAGARVVLAADGRGHFMANAMINGASLPFMLDTGATAVTISAADARRANINLTNAPRSMMQTANGVVAAYQVKFDTVKVGDIVLNNVDGVVMEGDTLGRFGLLGMSFLNRTDMKREGESMVLTRRF